VSTDTACQRTVYSPAGRGLGIGTTSTAWLPAAVVADPKGTAAPPGPLSVTLVNFSSTPSLNSSRISLGGETVPPTGGVAFSSWAWAKACVAASANAIEQTRNGQGAAPFEFDRA